jgi:hypothetical protein
LNITNGLATGKDGSSIVLSFEIVTALYRIADLASEPDQREQDVLLLASGSASLPFFIQRVGFTVDET